MKFKVFFILAGVVTLHGIVLTGICFTGGCKSTPVLEPRPFIPAPQKQDDKLFDDSKIADDKGSIPELTIKNQPVKPVAAPVAPAFKYEEGKSKGLTYTVRKNDSFWKIARKHGVTMQSLAAYNNMPLNKVLNVGEKLRIPPGGYVVKNLPPVKPRRKSPRKSRSVKVKALPRPSDGTYTVKSGDSFWKIAKRYNLKTKTLLKANNMTGKEVLQVGQKLIIPDGKGSVTSAAAASVSPVSAAATPKTDNSVKSILDAVDLPDDGKIDDKPKATEVTEAPKSVKKLIDDTTETPSLNSIDDGERAVQVIRDIKVEDFAKQYKVSPAVLKKLNDDYPADGVFKAGAVVIIRTTE